MKKFLILLFWLLVWQAAAILLHNPIFLVGPVEALTALARLSASPSFWQAVCFSFGRISLGFFLAFFLGILSGALAFRFFFVRELLSPVMQLFKSVPVASFVILALIWAGSENLSVLITFLVVLPIIYVGTVAGLESTDRQLLEMAAVFRVPFPRNVLFIYRAALFPYLASACRTGLGMGFKSGIAAEVIGVPSGSIGEGLYLSKIYLSTAELFAWTLVIILISALFEKVFLWGLKKGAGKGGQNIHENK